MWAIRDGRTGQIERAMPQIDVAQHVARARSHEVSNSIEVVELETMQVAYVYITGQEFIPSQKTTVFSRTLNEDSAEMLGREIWEDLSNRQTILARLLSKLKLSVHEQKQFDLTQDKVAEREVQLSFTLTDTEYQCAYYTFVGSQSRRRELGKPNYCERQIRRHTKRALIKTGQAASAERWAPIRLIEADSPASAAGDVERYCSTKT